MGQDRASFILTHHSQLAGRSVGKPPGRGVSLVGSTRTAESLEVHCRVDENDYLKGRKISDAQMANIKIKRNVFHDNWNYEIKPR